MTLLNGSNNLGAMQLTGTAQLAPCYQ
jgi:hypothetical protein